MSTAPRRAVTIPLASLVVLATVLCPGRASAAQSSDPFPYIAAVTADHVYVRCGAAPSYYPFGTLETGPPGPVAHTGAVAITQGGQRGAEAVGVIQHAGEAALRVADLLVRLHRPVCVEEQNPHGAAVRVRRRAPVVIPECPHGQVAYAVAVEITQ